MPASFATLLARSGYHRAHTILDNEKEKAAKGDRTESERFAVAALGFCLEHSPAWRHCFFQCILGEETGPEDTSAVWDIKVEPHTWADLVIIISRKAYLIECKINAQIVEHQNPWAEDFWNDRRNPEGYGIEFTKFCKENSLQLGGCRILHQNAEASKHQPKNKNGLDMSTKTWATLQQFWHKVSPNNQTESGLIQDLFNLFGQLGIRAFMYPLTNNIKMTKEAAKHAAECGAILSHAAARIGFDLEKTKLKTELHRDGSWSFGMDVTVVNSSSRFKNHRSIREFVKPSTKWLCWFGYEQSEDSVDQNPVVYIYCGTSKALSQVESKLIGFQLKKDETDPGWHNLTVSTKTNNMDSDREWFVSVFKKLGIEPVS